MFAQKRYFLKIFTTYLRETPCRYAAWKAQTDDVENTVVRMKWEERRVGSKSLYGGPVKLMIHSRRTEMMQRSNYALIRDEGLQLILSTFLAVLFNTSLQSTRCIHASIYQ